MKYLPMLLLLALVSCESGLIAAGRTGGSAAKTSPAKAAAPAKKAPMETAQQEKAEQAQAQAQAQALAAANQMNMQPDFTMQDMSMQQGGGDNTGSSDQTPTGKHKRGQRKSH